MSEHERREKSFEWELWVGSSKRDDGKLRDLVTFENCAFIKSFQPVELFSEKFNLRSYFYE